MNGGSEGGPVEEGTTGFRCRHCGEPILLTVVGDCEEISQLKEFLLAHRECLTQARALGA